jgi:hypothetical protein
LHLYISMKNIFLLIIALLVAQLNTRGAEQDSLHNKKVKEIITYVQHKYAPDRRTEVFNVRISDTTAMSLEVETTKPEAISELKSLLSGANIAFKLNEIPFPSKALGEKTYGVANLSVCNNRFEPDNSAEMATQVLLGTPVEILKKEHGYYLVRTPDRYISWTDDAGITSLDHSKFSNWQTTDKVVYTKEYGHAYEKPSLKSNPVSDLVAGNILQLIAKENKFYKVVYPDGRIGYVFLKDATSYHKWISRPNPTPGEILKTAYSLIGVPYLWGGTSIKGVDCSGFTKTCYFLNGIILPRDASQQALVGEKINIYENDTVSLKQCLKNLKAGDLLFFGGGKNRTSNPRITHTAIYIGNGKFIQSAGMVAINSMIPGSIDYDDYQSRTLVVARRMISAIGSPEISRIDQHPFYNTVKK